MLQKVRRIKSFIQRAMEKKVAPKNYIKFVIVARSRTGSNLLISLLNSHPNINAHGEIFRRIGEKSCNSIYNEVFPKRSYSTLGFKLFYYHPLDSNDKSIWKLLENNKTIKVIHLKRENLLRVHISRLIAEKNDVWSKSKKENISYDKKSVNIDLKLLLKDIENTNNQIKSANQLFENHEVYNVTYEDLVADSNKEISKILKFLEVSEMELTSSLKKQNPEKLENLVENFNEVKIGLKDTPYSFMLTE